EKSSKRDKVIAEIERMACEWVQMVSRSKGIEDTSQKAFVCSYGSYSLGVHLDSSDIDLLCIAPVHVTSHDFFTHFLHSLQCNPNISNILSIPTAFIPLLKFTYQDIEVDMVFGQWNEEVIDLTTFDLSDDYIFPNKESIMSVNGLGGAFVQKKKKKNNRKKICEFGIMKGARITQWIKKASPQLGCLPKVPSYYQILGSTLCFFFFFGEKKKKIKKCIYSNVLGYLGGISWTIMVAHICQKYPNASVAVIITHFFHTFASWKFESIEPIPIMINQLKFDEDETGWGWRPDTSKQDWMVILTPLHPMINCAHNVIEPTYNVIMSELRAADVIIGKRSHCIDGTVDVINVALWKSLFRPNQFFKLRHAFFYTHSMLRFLFIPSKNL
ncbi:poly (a) polymerase type 1, partial [Reticulomyxa filosa]